MGHVLRVENLCKRFPGVLAVNDVSMALGEGEILALVGANGAGKSTLGLILSGIHQPDSGHIFLADREVAFASPHEAIQAGIGMVFQELSLVGSLSIGENLFANRQPVGRMSLIRWRELYGQTAEFLRRFDLDLDPHRPVKTLSMGQQQILEILKAISNNPKVLILDEPTSSLTESELAYLLENIRALRTRGMSFIYITHKLREVFQIADRVMVMRDGRHVGTRAIAEVTERELVAMMVGHEIADLYGTAAKKFGPEYFRVEGLTKKGVFENLSIELHRGEILGLAGLVGAHRSEAARAIVGADAKDGGRAVLNGRPQDIASPADAIRRGIAYLTEDRKEGGLFVNMTVRDNLIAPSLRQFATRLDFMNGRKIDAYAWEKIRAYSIVAPSSTTKVMKLSGGNQQKVFIAAWMGTRPEVIILDEPTRGVDVGARAEIYHILRETAAAGVGIIMISSDLPELIGMCDRIVVMHQGRITGELTRDQFSEEKILTYAAGLGHPTGQGDAGPVAEAQP
ncbi:MAG TPA: sugar ABC transporter ATP-binding protein [bacterium]